ncbi:hypothetical protein [Conexibacter woesei]|uniref:hypothetical protein n=1 Tax=Conexibacter woesei TaxID=191495 RepID=UPI00042A032E|nr:hypothetical protein [Conexibacter woesei]
MPTPEPLVKVAHAQDQVQADALQELLRAAGIPSIVQRAPGFDVPDFLAAGPRDILVGPGQAQAARDTLPQRDGPALVPERAAGDAPSRVLAGVLIAVALVALVVCLAADVLV